jgi:hypothetical protein
MTADDNTHRERVNPTGAHDTDVQQIVTLLRQRGCSATLNYLWSLTDFAEPQLRARLDDLEGVKRINVLIKYNNVCFEILGGDSRGQPILTDGSGHFGKNITSLTPNEIFDILSNARRRRLITKLAELTPTGEAGETHLEIGKIATAVAVARHGVSPEELSHDDRHRAYVSLTQVHAETLEEYGVAEYHKRVKKITPKTDVHALAAIIKAVEAAAEDEM